MNDAVLYGVTSGVATLTMNRPDNRNAMSADLLNGLGDGLDRALADDGVRVIVITNNGNTFCAGADLKNAGGGGPRFDLVRILSTILDSPKPVVGRIAGHCMGGGVGLAAACDISVASDETKFGFTEVRIGAAPAIISVVCLRKLRRADASELFLSGERVPAERAVAVGLVNRAVAAGELDAAVAEVIDKLLLGGPGALAASKQLIAKVPDMPRADAFEWTAQFSASLFKSDEAAAGMAAFRDKTVAPWVPQR